MLAESDRSRPSQTTDAQSGGPAQDSWLYCFFKFLYFRVGLGQILYVRVGLRQTVALAAAPPYLGPQLQPP